LRQQLDYWRELIGEAASGNAPAACGFANQFAPILQNKNDPPIRDGRFNFFFF
jgi:hypothetical protein